MSAVPAPAPVATATSTCWRPVPKAITPVFGSVTLSVADYGADPTGVAESTAAFNAAIAALPASTGGTVAVPAGTYLVDAVASIVLRSNLCLRLDPAAVLQVMPNDQTHYGALTVQNVHDVLITGGTIIGDRDAHTFAPQPVVKQNTHEWGHGIRLFGCSRVVVQDVSILNCTGDGLSVASTGAAGQPGFYACADIFLLRVTADGCRRQGLSIGKTHGVVVQGCTFRNIGKVNGTLPMDGIDIEPENGDQCTDVFIDGCLIDGCAKNGIEGSQRADVNSPVQGVQVTNCTIQNNGGAGGYFGRLTGLEFSGNTITGNSQSGLYVGANATTAYIAENTLGNNYTRGNTVVKVRQPFALVGADKSIEADILNRAIDPSVIVARNYLK